jgi:hypothetical protein
MQHRAAAFHADVCVAKPPVHSLELNDAAFVFLRRVVAFVDALEFVASLLEFIQHGDPE